MIYLSNEVFIKVHLLGWESLEIHSIKIIDFIIIQIQILD